MTSNDNYIIRILEDNTVKIVKIDSALSNYQQEFLNIHAEIKVLQDDVKTLKSDTSHIQTSIYWGFALVSIFIAITGFLITLAPSILELLKNKINSQKTNYVTPEQVQDIVDKAISKALSNIGK